MKIWLHSIKQGIKEAEKEIQNNATLLNFCILGHFFHKNVGNSYNATSKKKKKKKSDIKMHRGSKQTFFQRRYSGNQQTCEKMLNITNQQGNANQNHNDILPHTY